MKNFLCILLLLLTCSLSAQTIDSTLLTPRGENTKRAEHLQKWREKINSQNPSSANSPRQRVYQSGRTRGSDAVPSTTFNYVDQIGGEKLPLWPDFFDSDDQGNFYVVDGALGQVFMYTASGEFEKVILIEKNPGIRDRFGDRPNFGYNWDGFTVDPSGEYFYLLTYWANGASYTSILKFDIATGAFVGEFGSDVLDISNRNRPPRGLDTDAVENVYVTNGNVVRKFSNTGEYLGLLTLPFATDTNTDFEKIEIVNNTFFIKDGGWAQPNRTAGKVHIFNNTSYTLITVPETYFYIPSIVADDQHVWLVYPEDPWDGAVKVFRKYEYNLAAETVDEVFRKEIEIGMLAINPVTEELLTFKTNDVHIGYPVYSTYRLDTEGNELGLFYPTNWDAVIPAPVGVDFDDSGNINVWDLYFEQIKTYNTNYTLLESKSIYELPPHYGALKDSHDNKYYIDGWRYDLVRYNDQNEIVYTIDIASATFYAPIFSLVLDPTETYLYLIQQAYDSWTNPTLTYTRIKKYVAATGAYVGEVGVQGTGVGQYQRLISLDVDSEGNLYAADLGKQCIHKFSSDGNYIRQIGTVGEQDGQFLGIEDLEIDNKDRLLVLDNSRNDVQVLSSEGEWLSTFGGFGMSGENFVSAANIKEGPDHRIYICDMYGSRVLVFEEETLPVKISAQEQTGRKNSEITLPITVENFTTVTALQFSIEWNPTVVTYAGVSQFSIDGLDQKSFGTTQAADGKIILSWTAPALTAQSVSNGSTLFAVSFILSGSPGATTSINITGPIEVIGDSFTEVEYEVVTGNIHIQPSATIEGTVTHHEIPLSGVGISTTDTNTTYATVTDDRGYFTQVVPSAIDYTLTPSKATDVDSYLTYLNAADLAAVQRHVLKTEIISDVYRLVAADVNNSQSVTTLDKVLVEAVILGLQNLPNNEQWKFVPADHIFNGVNPFVYPQNKTLVNVIDDVTENFVAIHVGDVVNSSNNSGRTKKDEYIFNITMVHDENTHEVRAMVRGSGFIDVSAFQAAFTWDESLEFLGIEPRGIEPRTNVTTNTLRMVWDEANGQSQTFADGSVLFVLTFKENANGQQRRESKLALSPSLAPQAYNRNLQGGEIALTWAPTEAEYTFHVSEPYPNPFSTAIATTVTLAEAGEVKLTISDVQGRVIHKTAVPCEKGSNNVFWKGIDVQGKTVPTGLYLLKIQTGTFSKTVKIIKE